MYSRKTKIQELKGMISLELTAYAVIAILVFALVMKVLQAFSRTDIFGKTFMIFAGVVIAFLLIATYWEKISPWLVLGCGVVLLSVLGLVAYRSSQNY